MDETNYQPDCVLCQLVAGRLPMKKVLETNEFLVIYDKNPRAPIHLLVIDKKHRLKKDTLTGRYFKENYWDKMFAVADQAVKKLGLDKKGYRLEILAGGLEHYPHEHLHILAG